MKIYVIGVGGVGGYFGGLMAKGGLDVTFVARNDNFKAIKEKGLRVGSTEGDFVIERANVINKISDISNPDVIFLTIKTYDSKQVAQELISVIGDRTILITLQNGMDNDKRIKEFLPSSRVYPGAAYVISTLLKPGIISQTGGQRRIVFGDRNNSHNHDLEELATRLERSGVTATASDDISRDIWRKFILIVAFSSMTAITKMPIGKVLENSIWKSQYESIVHEAIAVAISEKINLPKNIFEEIMITTAKTAPDSKSSLLVDIENNRRTEIDTLVGALVELANKHNIDVPISLKIYEQLKSIITA